MKPRLPGSNATDAETARIATNLFKLFNFELFMKENKVVMASGVAVVVGLGSWWGYQYLTTGEVGTRVQEPLSIAPDDSVPLRQAPVTGKLKNWD